METRQLTICLPIAPFGILRFIYKTVSPKPEMKHPIQFLSLLAFLIVITTACNDSKEIAAAQPERSFVIGTGGGFTGAYEIYRVNSSGTVELQNEDGKSYSSLKTLPNDSTIQAFAALDKLALEGYRFNRPDNMTNILEVETEAGTNTIKWGAIQHPIRDDIGEFFKRTMKMVRADYE